MNPADPLAQLSPIHLPEQIGNWPPAYGWWLLATLIIASVVGMVWLVLRHKKRKRFKVEALYHLELFKSQFTQDKDPYTALTSINTLLKRVCITQHGRNEVAGLTGNDWLKLLDKTGSTQAFTQGAGRALVDDLYKPGIDVPIDQLFKLAHSWITAQKC